MFEVSVVAHFSAAHRLAEDAGKCARLHGHNWEVEVFVRGEELNEAGMLIDFRELRRRVREEIEDLDHSDLNELAPFRDAHPTSENLARLLYGRLARKLNGVRCRVHRVGVRETPGTRAGYWE